MYPVVVITGMLNGNKMINYKRIFTINSTYAATELSSILKENIILENRLSWYAASWGGKDFKGEILDNGEFWLEERPVGKGDEPPSIKGQVHPTEEGCQVTIELNMNIWYKLLNLVVVAGFIGLLTNGSGVGFRIILIVCAGLYFLFYLFHGIPNRLDETEQKLRNLLT